MPPSQFVDKKNEYLRTNAILITTTGVIVVLILASSFTQTAVFPFGQKLQVLKLSMFGLLIVLFSSVEFIFLRYIIKITQTSKPKVVSIFYFTKLHRIVAISHVSLTALLLAIFAQIVLFNSYDLLFSIAIVLITHITTIGILSILARQFLIWFNHNRDITVMLFSIAVTLLCTNLAFSLAYFTNESRDDPRYITSLRGQVTPFTSPYSIFEQVYVITYILSFIAIWFATVSLLFHYSRKIGRVKFSIILAIPVIYFILQFQTGFLEFLLPFRLSNPTLFGILYTFLFSAAKPIGGILAGIAFWNIARSVNQNYVRFSMTLSACGIMLLFSSNQGSKMVAPSFPPLDLAIISFMILSSYFLMAGIYFSAISVAQDTKLRRVIVQSKRSLEKELGFLGSIGSSELEREVQFRVENVAKRFADVLESDSGIPTSLDETDIKEYVNSVIKEKQKLK